MIGANLIMAIFIRGYMEEEMNAMERNLFRAIELYIFDRDRKRNVDLSSKDYNTYLDNISKALYRDVVTAVKLKEYDKG